MGCDVVLQLEDRPSTTTCSAGGVADSFDSGTACAPWARAVESMATVTLEGGELIVQPNSGAIAAGMCQAFLSTALADDGVSLEVTRIPSAASGYTMLTVLAEDRTHVTAELITRDGMLGLQVPGSPPVMSMPYDATRMRWWRLRPDPDGAGMLGEFSSDGTSWQSLAVVPGAIPAKVFVTIAAGTRMPDPDPGRATFGLVRFCTPD